MYEKMEVFLDNFFSLVGQFIQILAHFLRTFRIFRRYLIVFRGFQRMKKRPAGIGNQTHGFCVLFAVAVERFYFFYFFRFFAGFVL